MTKRFTVQLKLNSGGYTLIESILYIALAGIIGSAIALTVFHTLAMNSLNTNHILAVKQVENAVFSISRDAFMSDEFQLKHPDGSSDFSSPLVLAWKDWDGTLYSSSYTLNGSVLERVYKANGTIQSVKKVADYIDSPVSRYRFNGGVITVTIGARVGGYKTAIESRTFRIVPETGR